MSTEAPTVTITVERLKELEAAAARLSHVEERLRKRNHNNVDRINAYNKAHPDKVAERYRKHVEKDRDSYNAKRRERYRQRKEAATATTAAEPPGGAKPPAVV